MFYLVFFFFTYNLVLSYIFHIHILYQILNCVTQLICYILYHCKLSNSAFGCHVIILSILSIYLWTQTMYENIVVFCVIFSKMSFENANMIQTNVHTCGKTSITPEAKTVQRRKVLETNFTQINNHRPSTGLLGIFKLKTSGKRHLESLPHATKCTTRKAIMNSQPARKVDLMRRTPVIQFRYYSHQESSSPCQFR